MSTTLQGTTIVITGASSGIGREAAIALAAQGADLAIVGRDHARTEAVASQVGGTPFFADYDRLDDVRKLAADLLAKYPAIQVLANNAGGIIAKRGMSADGHERTFQHNHLAPFLLTQLLLPRLLESTARVISTASAANLFGRVRLNDLDYAKVPWFGGWPAYSTSKLETILFIRELTKRTGLEAYSFHPGLVATRFGSESASLKIAGFFSGGRAGISAEQGAAGLIHLASAPEVGIASGTYFDGLKPNGLTVPAGNNMTLAAQLWDKTQALVS